MSPPAARPEPIAMVPIGVVRSSRDEAIDDDWDAVESSIELMAGYWDGDAG